MAIFVNVEGELVETSEIKVLVDDALADVTEVWANVNGALQQVYGDVPVPPPVIPRYEMNFVGNTNIWAEDDTIDMGALTAYTFEYTIRIDSSYSSQSFWSTLSGLSGSWWVRSGSLFTVKRGDATTGSIEILFELGVEYKITETLTGDGTITIDVDLLGTYEITPAVSGADVTDGIFFGGNTVGGGASQSIQGTIKDVRYTDASSAVLHFWPINDGPAAIIKDNVGVMDGALVAANGYWSGGPPVPKLLTIGEPFGGYFGYYNGQIMLPDIYILGLSVLLLVNARASKEINFRISKPNVKPNFLTSLEVVRDGLVLNFEDAVYLADYGGGTEWRWSGLAITDWEIGEEVEVIFNP